MKKYWIFYIIVAILTITMIVTKGFPSNLLMYSYNDAESGIIDGFQGEVSLSQINIIYVSFFTLLTILVTISKKNKLKLKWLFMCIIICLMFLVRLGIDSYSGGIAGILGDQGIYLWNIWTYISNF